MGFRNYIANKLEKHLGTINALEELYSPNPTTYTCPEEAANASKIVEKIWRENHYDKDPSKFIPEVRVLDTPKIAKKLKGVIPTAYRNFIAGYMNATIFHNGVLAENPIMVITLPMVQHLSQRELTAIIGHEIGHLSQKDENVEKAMKGEAPTNRFSLIGALKILVTMILGQFKEDEALVKKSKEDEFEADELSGRLTGDRFALISANQKIEAHHAKLSSNLDNHGFVSFFSKLIDRVLGKITDTHPNNLERELRLRSNIKLLGDGSNQSGIGR